MNVAVLVPVPTVTDAGAVSRLLTVDRTIFAPGAAAVFVSVTVHVLEVAGPSVVGLHTSEDTNAGATRVTVAFFELPLYVAVTVAL